MAFFLVFRATLLDQEIRKKFPARLFADQNLHIVEVAGLRGNGRAFDELPRDFAEAVVVIPDALRDAVRILGAIEYDLAVEAHHEQIVARADEMVSPAIRRRDPATIDNEPEARFYFSS